MFTGLIEEVGRVRQLQKKGTLQRMEVSAGVILDDAEVGDSIDISGACHTVVELMGGQRFAVESVAETLQRTTMGQLGVGDPVNLERSLRTTDRLGGHLVLGHVDGVGTVRRFDETGEGNWVLEIAPPEDLLRYIAPKGSIAVDGISLTVVNATDTTFTVAIIPHTLSHTNLGQVAAGSRVNLEADVLARYVERLLSSTHSAAETPAGGLSLERMREMGY